MRDPKNNTVLWNGEVKEEIKPSFFSSIIESGKRENMRYLGRDKEAHVIGWLLAWDTSWWEQHGGIPSVSTEDYAMSVIARNKGKQIEHVPDAKTWGFSINTLKDLVSVNTRQFRGRFQMLEQDPSLLSIMRQDYYAMEQPHERLKKLYSWFKNWPGNRLLLLGSFLGTEYVRIKAMFEYKKNPLNQSWEKTSSPRK